jgi:cytidine deaminase
MSPDWETLRAAAAAAMRRAYAPYSNFPVGVAALVDDGRVLSACNVENVSYGLGLCAECGLVSMLHASGGGRLVAMACVDGNGNPLMPCGRCRQLLWEHGGPKLLIDHAHGPVTMADLLPHAFDDVDLGKVGQPSVDSTSRVPGALSNRVGSGTAFLHPDVAGGQQVWTGYWSAGRPGDPEGSASVIEEGPVWPDAGSAVAWGRARTPRVVVIDGEGHTYWAGAGARPEEFAEEWRP